jgi:hypothetical protein
MLNVLEEAGSRVFVPIIILKSSSKIFCATTSWLNIFEERELAAGGSCGAAKHGTLGFQHVRVSQKLPGHFSSKREASECTGVISTNILFVQNQF